MKIGPQQTEFKQPSDHMQVMRRAEAAELADKDAVGVAAGVETNRLEVVGSVACLLLRFSSLTTRSWQRPVRFPVPTSWFVRFASCTASMLTSASHHPSRGKGFVLVIHETGQRVLTSLGAEVVETSCSTALLAAVSNINMIRRGKMKGWLQLPQDAFLPWTSLNEVTFDRTVPGSIPGRGGALLARDDLNADEDMSNVLLTVPADLILSLERVQEHAKVDKDFREVLESLADFGRVGLTW